MVSFGLNIASIDSSHFNLPSMDFLDFIYSSHINHIALGRVLCDTGDFVKDVSPSPDRDTEGSADITLAFS